MCVCVCVCVCVCISVYISPKCKDITMGDPWKASLMNRKIKIVYITMCVTPHKNWWTDVYVSLATPYYTGVGGASQTSSMYPLSLSVHRLALPSVREPAKGISKIGCTLFEALNTGVGERRSDAHCERARERECVGVCGISKRR